VAVRGDQQRAYQVHKQMEELACGHSNGVEQSRMLLVDRPQLAVSAHGYYILADPLPHKMCSPHAFGGTYDRADHAVNGVENGRSGCQGQLMPHTTSHARLAPSTWTDLIVTEEAFVACRMLIQLTWLAAISRHASCCAKKGR